LIVALTFSAEVSPAKAKGSDSNIVGGDDASGCALPAVAALATAEEGAMTAAYLCTGTLVHPRVMVYAAHCEHLLYATFGPTGEGGVYSNILKTGVNPTYNPSSPAAGEKIDWAYAVFEEDISNVPVIPLAAGCELDYLQQVGNDVTLAGFSPNLAPAPRLTARGAQVLTFDTSVQRFAASTISGIESGVIQAGGFGIHACGGDSGGPLLAQLPDGTWRTIGITSTIYGSCNTDAAYNHWSQVRAEMIEWLETETEIDLTPCFDDSGVYVESSECDDFMVYAGDPTDPVGLWSSSCANAPKGWAGEHCASGSDSTDTSSGSSDETTGGTGSDESSSTTETSSETSSPSEETATEESSDFTSDTSSDTELSSDATNETSDVDSTDTFTSTTTNHTLTLTTSTSAVETAPPGEYFLPQGKSKSAATCSLSASSEGDWSALSLVAIALFLRRRPTNARS
jgi:hypothetical protein